MSSTIVEGDQRLIDMWLHGKSLRTQCSDATQSRSVAHCMSSPVDRLGIPDEAVSEIVRSAPPAGDYAGVVDRCGDRALIVQRSGTRRVDASEFSRKGALEATRTAARRRGKISTDERTEIVDGTDQRGVTARTANVTKDLFG